MNVRLLSKALRFFHFVTTSPRFYPRMAHFRRHTSWFIGGKFSGSLVLSIFCCQAQHCRLHDVYRRRSDFYIWRYRSVEFH